jgi:triacylglycerol lipase
LRDLTTQCQRVFNPTYRDNPDVAYFSVAGRGRTGYPPVSAPLFLFHQYISAKTGDANHGLIAVTSAKWGTFDPNLWEADRAEEAGYNLDNLLIPPDFPYLAKYDALLANVAHLI